MEQNLMSCPQRCCLFVNGQAASEDEFKAAAQQLVAGVEIREMRIICLKAGDNKIIAEAVGFYVGNPEWNVDELFFPSTLETGLVTAQRHSVYDLKTNEYLGPITFDYIAKWRAARTKLIEERKGSDGTQ